MTPAIPVNWSKWQQRMWLNNMQRSTGYIKTKGQIPGLVSGVRPVEFKFVTHKRQRLEFGAKATRISIRIPHEATKTYRSFNRKLKACNGHSVSPWITPNTRIYLYNLRMCVNVVFALLDSSICTPSHHSSNNPNNADMTWSAQTMMIMIPAIPVNRSNGNKECDYITCRDLLDI